MAHPTLPPISRRQRLRAARHLAGGDCAVLVAAHAGISATELDQLQFDPEFQALVEASREIHQMDAVAYRARVDWMVRDALEDALVEGRVSTLNLLLRTGSLPQEEPDYDDDDEDERPGPRPGYVPAGPEVDPVREARRQALIERLMPFHRGVFGWESLARLEGLFPGHREALDEIERRAAVAAAAAGSASGDEPAASVDGTAAVDEPLAADGAAAPVPVEAPALPAEASLEAPAASGDACPDAALAVESALLPPPPPGSKAARALLRTRLARLLDRSAERLPEEGPLAEAVCAVLIPKWPTYAEPVDLVDLKDVLAATPLDSGTLAWLASVGFPFTSNETYWPEGVDLAKLAQAPGPVGAAAPASDVDLTLILRRGTAADWLRLPASLAPWARCGDAMWSSAGET